MSRLRHDFETDHTLVDKEAKAKTSRFVQMLPLVSKGLSPVAQSPNRSGRFGL